MRQPATDSGSEAVLRDLAPTGRIRACSTAGNPALNTRDPVTGELRGLAVDVTHELGARLGTEAVLTGYATDILRAVVTAECDLAFVSRNVTAPDIVDVTPPIVGVDLTLLIPHESRIRAIGDADQAGIRVSAGTEPVLRAFTLQMPQAELVRAGSAEEAFALLESGNVDAFAGNREQALSFSNSRSEFRVLEDRFAVLDFVLAVPNGRAAGLAFLSAFVEETKASGFLAASLERSGTRGVSVAPPSEPLVR